MFEVAQVKLEREIRARHFTGNRDQLPAQPFSQFVRRSGGRRRRVGRDQHRTVAIAHARAAGKERITIAHIGVGVNRDGRDIELGAHGALVQGLDIFQAMLKLVAAQVDLVFGHGVKHEGIIRIG